MKTASQPSFLSTSTPGIVFAILFGVLSAVINCANALPTTTTIIPKTGPCTIGTHQSSIKLNCTPNGYFSLVQCLSDYCVCVNPFTGHEYEGTQTFTNKIAPRCGNCSIEVARRLARGQTSLSSLPTCENEVGDYTAKQCLSNVCKCVDPSTGRTTQSSISPTVPCPTPTPTSVPTALSIDAIPAAQKQANSGVGDMVVEDRDDTTYFPPQCQAKFSHGTNCTAGRPRVMYYFDPSIGHCLAFKYNGCGGNQNRFSSMSECWATCIPQDFGGCAMLKRPYKKPDGEALICGYNSETNQHRDCPNGYKCVGLAFFSVCCEAANEERFYRNYAPKCGTTGSGPLTVDTKGGITVNLLGKSCSDGFCPSNTTCVQLDLLAHCCPK